MVAGYTGTQAARHLHLHRRHREPRRAAGGAHQGGCARILIDDATQAALAGRVAVDALGAVQFKGKSQPVEVFAIGAPRAA